MTFLSEPLQPTRPAFLGTVAPVTRLVAGVFIVGSATLTTSPRVASLLLAAAFAALAGLSGLPFRRTMRRLAPVLISAVGLAILTALLAPSPVPGEPPILALGPFTVSAGSLATGLGLALRLFVFAVTSVLIFATSDTTTFADSLVQQWHVPDRFAYGTIAALRIAPLLASDWYSTGAARRLRGIGGGGLAARTRALADRLLVLLVSAVRRSERIALAMDARGFDSGRPRSRYRVIRVGRRDAVLLVAAALVAVGAHVLA